MLAAARLGGKYAVALGGATAVYVLVDESVGWAREEYIGSRGAVVAQPVLEEEDIGDDEGLPRRRASWRKGGPEWEDGALAGGLLGAGVGTACESSHILYQHADMARSITETPFHEIHDHRNGTRRHYIRLTSGTSEGWEVARRGSPAGQGGGGGTSIGRPSNTGGRESHV